MQLFNAINDWAGRSAWLDETLRFFYVCAVPLLATLLAAVLIFAPRHPGAAARRRVAGAALLSIALCVLALPAVNAFARNCLDADILSPRPFVTHRVNLLLIEPNDNSFPCAEVMLGAALATLLWAASPRWGLLGWIWVAAFGVARVFCGSNFPADIIAGWALGFGVGGLSLALCRAPLHFGLPGGRRLTWQAKFQGVCALLTLLGVAVITLYAFAQTPRFGAKIRGLLNVPRASAADTLADARERTSSTLTSHEGEGVPLAATSSPANTSGDQHRSDYLPKVEALLRAAWQPLGLPHRILTVDVAQVRAGNTAYRNATVRFVVGQRGAAERRRVLQTATRLVQAAYHADAQLQNVDVVGVMLNAQSEDYAPRPVVVPGALPVFSASVARKDLDGLRHLPAHLAAQNPGAAEPDAAWLRMRSLLYLNERVLPIENAPTPAPVPHP